MPGRKSIPLSGNRIILNGIQSLQGKALFWMTPRAGKYSMDWFGGKGKTLILTGHYDVVDTAEYGEFQHYAWDTEAWERLRAGRENGDRDRARAEESAEAPGSILFAAVPDEEAFSAGMRGAVPLFAELAGRYGLEYGGFMDLEPCALEPCAVAEETDSQRVYIGSVGKLMPAVLVQGDERAGAAVRLYAAHRAGSGLCRDLGGGGVHAAHLAAYAGPQGGI